MLMISRRALLGASAGLCAVRSPFAWADAKVMQVFVGCYTNASGENVPTDFGTHRGPQDLSKGVYSFTFDTTTGKAGPIALAAETTNPVNLIMHSNRRFLYACRGQNTRVDGQNVITAFAIENGKLRELNTVRSGGGGPTVGAVDASGKNLLTTNFSTNSIVCFRLNKDGSLGERSAMIGKEPVGEIPNAMPPSSGMAAAAQTGPNPGGLAPGVADRAKPHAIVLSKTERFAVAAEISANRCHVMRFDAAKGSLVTHQFADDTTHSGPRHLAFHPSYKFLYTSGEENSSVTAWSWDEVKGELKPLQNASTLPAGFSGTNNPADVVVHPSGKFVYVTNRGAGTLAGFRIDQKTGLLSAIEPTQLGSPACWGMIFDPSGKWALAAAQIGDEILCYSVDQNSGALKPTGQKLKTMLPSCLRWA
ncbi:MAG: lactonase family protein [Steroidobacteraceae bacterium]